MKTDLDLEALDVMAAGKRAIYGETKEYVMDKYSVCMSRSLSVSAAQDSA